MTLFKNLLALFLILMKPFFGLFNFGGKGILKIHHSKYLVLVSLFDLFKVIVTDKMYLKPLFSSNKSLNKSIILLFAKNNESLRLISSAISTS